MHEFTTGMNERYSEYETGIVSNVLSPVNRLKEHIRKGKSSVQVSLN